MFSIIELWKAGGVNRWHSHDNPALRNSQDTNWAHSARVAQLVHLFGGSPEEIVIALYHDAPEKITGDKRSGTKNYRDRELESAIAKDMGIPANKTKLVHLCDWIDAFLWARLHGDGKCDAWREQYKDMATLAVELKLEHQFASVVSWSKS